MRFSLAELLAASSTRPTGEPAWAVDAPPAEPWPLLTDWIRAAVGAGVLAARTVTLATATADGTPSARTVLLSDVTEDGFWFATSASGPTGRDLAENPVASLVWYAREQSRQVRVTGSVVRGDADRAAAAFRARGATSRAATLAGRQSAPLPGDAASRIRRAEARLQADPELVDPDWAAYLVAPAEVEFWQSRHDVGEQRLRYRREHDGWRFERLWP
ncbi:pyridoxal 5'-phosphate synthase [Amnibacterium sp.]|uniref:pyridoxine/pyridoxamine 5'-phosphate oxidase n=1 Tax=Amnibacterium sp. TaxID=1872496 RepID=UPI00262795B1|nr:pyridoxal 5'-phosphate synthase [Amnibacterium sp.]MCU1474667.1 pyridoxamine 5prime-phosphate oxidase [Amnibacterium sp.]